MLCYTNQFWRFNNEAELNQFLDAAARSKDEYRLQRAGKARNGTYYAFGDVKVNPKDEEAQSQANAEATQNANVPEVA